jgi:hypothetical protein
MSRDLRSLRSWTDDISRSERVARICRSRISPAPATLITCVSKRITRYVLGSGASAGSMCSSPSCSVSTAVVPSGVYPRLPRRATIRVGLGPSENRTAGPTFRWSGHQAVPARGSPGVVVNTPCFKRTSRPLAAGNGQQVGVRVVALRQHLQVESGQAKAQENGLERAHHDLEQIDAARLDSHDLRSGSSGRRSPEGDRHSAHGVEAPCTEAVERRIWAVAEESPADPQVG